MTVMADKILTAEPFEDGTALTVAGVEGTRPGQIRKWKNLLFGSNIAPNGTPATDAGKGALVYVADRDTFAASDGENWRVVAAMGNVLQ